MFEAPVLDTRLVKIMEYGFRARVINTLGAMVNVDSEVFYTASDVALFILERSGIDVESLTSSDRREFISAVSSILSTAFRNGLSSVYRTSRRIHPKYYKGRASYGYRIGMATGRRVINSDSIREHKSLAASYITKPVVDETAVSALHIGERAVELMGYTELCQLELTIQARKEKLFRELEEKTK